MIHDNTGIRGTKSLHTTTNCYLVSLALADLITLLSSVPQEVLSYHILGDMWVWGSLGCSLMVYAQFLAMNASALSLTAFTIERYIAICHPMKAQVRDCLEKICGNLQGPLPSPFSLN